MDGTFTNEIVGPDALSLDERISSLENKVDRMLEIHERLYASVEEIKPTVLDVVNGLQKNPMLRMFTGGK